MKLVRKPKEEVAKTGNKLRQHFQLSDEAVIETAKVFEQAPDEFAQDFLKACWKTGCPEVELTDSDKKAGRDIPGSFKQKFMLSLVYVVGGLDELGITFDELVEFMLLMDEKSMTLPDVVDRIAQ